MLGITRTVRYLECRGDHYIILAGFPPFEGRDNREIMKAIQAGEFDVEESPGRSISEAAKGLIRKMLCAETSRLSSKQALEDAWITDNLPPHTEESWGRYL